MKKVFEYIATLLLLLAVGTSCEEGNDNWKVITAVPTGLYITGDATIYSCLLYTSPSPRDTERSRMPSSA